MATVPGITAMQDLAARSGTVLCEGRETLALLPLTAGLVPFREALAHFDTVVGYKSGSHLPEVLAAVRDAGRLDGAVHGASLGLPGEDIRPAAEVSRPGAVPVHAARARAARPPRGQAVTGQPLPGAPPNQRPARAGPRSGSSAPGRVRRTCSRCARPR